MRGRFTNFSSVRLTTYSLLALSLFVLAATIYMTFSIDVLKDWTLTLPNQKIRVNDSITIQSTYDKVTNVKGVSVRYLDCDNKNGLTIRYPLNQAVADRAPNKGGTGVVVVMPDTIPDLPAKCRVSIVIDYPVLPWRHVIETQETNTFILYPSEEASASGESSVELGKSQTQLPTSGQAGTPSSSSFVASSFQSAPKNDTAQQDISQGEPVREQTMELEPIPQPQPILGIPLVDSILRGLGL